MRSKLFQVVFLVAVSALMAPSVLSAAENTETGKQENSADAQKYVGVWAGSFTTESGESNKLSFTFTKGEKGQWGGTAKWVNPEGDQSADFKSLQIADGKMKGKIESPDGQVEVTIEGQFQGDGLEGTYAISPKGSTEVMEKGNWKVAKSAAAKTGH